MKKVSCGKCEKFVPTMFCDNLNYKESQINYPVDEISVTKNERGCVLEFPLSADEQVYGFGLQLKCFNHKGSKLCLRVNSDPVSNTGDSHAPVPFFVTTKGYGIFIDTLRVIEAHIGYIKKKFRKEENSNEVKIGTDELYTKEDSGEDGVISVFIPSQGVDVYIFEGKNITEAVAKYNMFSGGGCDVPEWGLGVMYRCFGKSNSDDIRRIAKYFKDNDVPCDILGFEPGWQSGSYPCTFVWDNERFADYKDLINELVNDGFHINLWEHAYVAAKSPIYEKMYDLSADYEVWQGLVPDFSLDKATEIFADYHKEQLVDLGIDGFKLDECDGSDYTRDWCFPNCAKFPSGMDGEQYHSIFGVLYMKAVLKALNGVKTLSEVRNAGALSSSYPFVLYSDLYDHKDFIRGVANCGFSGVLWAPEIREGASKKDFIRRLQTAVFSPQCVLNAWYCENMPWLDLDCDEETKKLLKEREKLVPMLKKAYDKYRDMGIPPVRALVMDYTNDENVYKIDDQYMLGDNLLVAPMTADEDERQVYLPKGNWKNYWTGEKVECGYHIVSGDDIPVYELI